MSNDLPNPAQSTQTASYFRFPHEIRSLMLRQFIENSGDSAQPNQASRLSITNVSRDFISVRETYKFLLGSKIHFLYELPAYRIVETYKRSRRGLTEQYHAHRPTFDPHVLSQYPNVLNLIESVWISAGRMSIDGDLSWVSPPQYRELLAALPYLKSVRFHIESNKEIFVADDPNFPVQTVTAIPLMKDIVASLNPLTHAAGIL